MGHRHGCNWNRGNNTSEKSSAFWQCVYIGWFRIHIHKHHITRQHVSEYKCTCMYMSYSNQDTCVHNVTVSVYKIQPKLPIITLKDMYNGRKNRVSVCVGEGVCANGRVDNWV